MDTSKAKAITTVSQYGNNVCVVSLPKGQVLYSYGTPVACYIWGDQDLPKDAHRTFHGDKYSVTTAKHITMHMPGSVQIPQDSFLAQLKKIVA